MRDDGHRCSGRRPELGVAGEARHTLTDHLPADSEPDALLEGFVDFVADQGLDLVHGAQIGGIQHHVHGAGDSDASAVEHRDMGAKARRQCQVVQYDRDRPPAACQFPEPLHQIELMVGIQRRDRLIR